MFFVCINISIWSLLRHQSNSDFTNLIMMSITALIVCVIVQLYVWDQGGQIPLLVKNKAAETLFGNVTAENVYKCYQESENQRPDHAHDRKQQNHSNQSISHYPESCRSNALTNENQNLGSEQVDCSRSRMKPNFYQIWLILVKTLLQHGKNSPFRFEITVDGDKDIGNGRFELVSFIMPCYESGKS